MDQFPADVLALLGAALRAVIGAQRWLMTELGHSLSRLAEGDAMVLPLAFALGLVHAATPGHGKSVVLTYFVGYKARPWAGLVMGLKIALSHVGSAVVLFVVLRLILDRTLRGMSDNWLPTVSYCGIALVGLVLIWQTLRGNHVHAPAGGGRGILPLLIGLVPCPITLSVLLVAVSQGHIAASLLLAAAMALGMATTLTGVALLAIALRASIAVFLERHAGLVKGMEVAGAVIITLIGLTLFWGALTGPKGPPL